MRPRAPWLDTGQLRGLTPGARAQSFLDATPEQIRAVVTTNLQGSLLFTRAAMRAMVRQPGGGHVFNMDGAGADGMATPQYAAYGATKAGARP